MVKHCICSVYGGTGIVMANLVVLHLLKRPISICLSDYGLLSLASISSEILKPFLASSHQDAILIPVKTDV